MNQTDRPTAAKWQMSDGMTVFSADGHKLGTVRNYAPGAGYLDVKKGFLFSSDCYVPAPAIVAVDDDGIELNLTKDEVESGRYGEPPQGATGLASSRSIAAERAAPECAALGPDDDGVEGDSSAMHTADGRRI